MTVTQYGAWWAHYDRYFDASIPYANCIDYQAVCPHGLIVTWTDKTSNNVTWTTPHCEEHEQ